MADPGHVAPPLDGLGFVQVRVFFLSPVPQVLEQAPKADHSDQPPFKTTEKEFQLYIMKKYGEKLERFSLSLAHIHHIGVYSFLPIQF